MQLKEGWGVFRFVILNGGDFKIIVMRIFFIKYLCKK